MKARRLSAGLPFPVGVLAVMATPGARVVKKPAGGNLTVWVLGRVAHGFSRGELESFCPTTSKDVAHPLYNATPLTQVPTG